MTERGSFENALAQISSVLEERGTSYALIGGLAVAVWGVPRATENIDLLADLAPSHELDAAFRAEGFRVAWRRADVDDPIPLLLRLDPADGPEVDIVCATRGWEREMLGRAITVRLPTGLEAPVMAVEDLIVLKLIAGGPSDLIDVAELLQQTSLTAEIEERAAARGLGELLSHVMASTHR